MPKEISVRSFYSSGCKNPINDLIHDKSQYSVLSACIRLMCESLAIGESRQNILSVLQKEMESSYEDSFFAFAWQKSVAISDDLAAFERFLDWLGDDVKVIAGKRELVCHVSPNTTLTSYVSMLCENPDGTVSAYIIHPGTAHKSVNGKSIHTSVQTDLYAMSAKYCLENEYPGCSVVLVYLKNSEDASGNIGAIRYDGTRKSNIFVLKFLSYYTDGYFDKDAFARAILHVMNTPVPAQCYECRNKQLCRLSQKGNSLVEIKEEKIDETYQMPTFTSAQKQVVDHMEGPLLVCAGPGSGKTATIVGRIKRLIDSGVPAVLILAITFTNKAAEELRRRCLSFCEEDFMPTIKTLNAFGYSILQKNEHLVGSLRVLSQIDRLKILSALMENRRIDKDLTYIDRKVRQYSTCDDRNAFLKKEGLSDTFVELYSCFQRIIQQNGYISFDEQITKCLDLFQDHPDVLIAIQKRYPYIMVDEYQDIDEAQATFIYQVADHGNIVAVGDDDQSIYGFRGGSNKYMLEFSKHFRNAQTVVLSDNFRSSKPIVDAAQHVIEKNTMRIKKNIRATKQGDDHAVPKVLTGGFEVLNSLVDQCIRNGYRYGDIAVLASKNATLEEWGAMVSFPHILEKTYLIEDSLFTIIRCSLDMILHGPTDRAFVSLSYAMQVPVSPSYGRSQYEMACELFGDVLHGSHVSFDSHVPMTRMLCALSFAKGLAANGYRASAFVEAMGEMLEMTNVLSYEHLLKLARHKSLSSFWETLDYMVLLSDDTRLETQHENAVTFTTCHDAKGKEYPVVILLDDFNEETGSEDVRLYYVALTRAMNQLYIIKKSGQSTLLETAG